MGMQMRSKDGTDKRWFDPERDFVYAFPRLLRSALTTFEDFQGTPECSREDLCKIGGKLGKMIASAAKSPVKPDDFQKELDELRASCPAGFNLLSSVVTYMLIGVYPRWCADVRPRTPEDAEIPTQDLEDVIARFARGAAASGKPGDAGNA